jgi:lipid-A-disaccharide synthase
MVVAYRVGRLTELLARRMIEVPYVAMPNLILGRGAIPELLQDRCTPEVLATQLEALLRDGAAQRADLAEIRRRLGLEELKSSGIRPSDRAAQVVLDAIRARRRLAY